MKLMQWVLELGLNRYNKDVEDLFHKVDENNNEVYAIIIGERNTVKIINKNHNIVYRGKIVSKEDLEQKIEQYAKV